ncbi:MAG: WecB/TagA/CpsF family glycosyltransferase [Kiritimatiellia bacterium]|jgi:N-acetylglucosaminyldiphosphoundecaprenol N-acetyl-beta-D-mannosaminyltransferase
MSDDIDTKGAASAGLPRFSLLDVRLAGVRLTQAVETILGYVKDGGRHYVCVFAVDSLLKCRDTPKLAAIANAADMTLCDGMPLVFVGRKIAKLDMDRCYGPDVMLRTIEAGCARGVRHFFYGGCDGTTIQRLEANLRAKFPSIQIVGSYVPPFRDLTDAERDDVVARIDASGADIVWVGIGTPRQDYWVSDYRPRLKAPVLIAVGAAFNFHAGTVPQAPRWMMRCGFEWLFRLLAEPRRLWRRYVIGNPRFIFLALKQWITRRPAPLGHVLRREDEV